MTMFYYQNGFYDDRFSDVPQEAVAISDEVYLELLNGQATGKHIVSDENGQPRLIEPTPSAYHTWNGVQWVADETQQLIMLDEEKARLLRKISDQTDRLKAAKLASYPQTEIDSFYRQEQEARAWLADNSTPTPMLSAMVGNYQDMADLCGRIIQKAEYFAAMMGQMLSVKQAFEKRVKEATTLDALQHIEAEVAQWQLSA
ncbi:hypothetical protein [Muribacter muris]|nr:hypothetical protein [Muribacter muris]